MLSKVHRQAGVKFQRSWFLGSIWNQLHKKAVFYNQEWSWSRDPLPGVSLQLFWVLILKKKKQKQGAQCWLLSFHSSCRNLTVTFGRSSAHSHLYQHLCLGLDKCLWGRWEWWPDPWSSQSTPSWLSGYIYEVIRVKGKHYRELGQLVCLIINGWYNQLNFQREYVSLQLLKTTKKAEA